MTTSLTSAPAPSSWRALRSSAGALVDDLGRYVLVNVALSAVAWVVLALGRRQPAALLLGVFLVPLAGGVARMAARSARGERPGWHDFRAGLTHRWATTWSLGSAAVVVTLVGVLNVLSAAAGGLLVLSAVVSLQVMAASGAALTAIWPLLFDPHHDDQPGRCVVRQGLVVLATHPRRIIAVLAVEAVLVLAQVTVVATAFVLPALMALLAAFTMGSVRVSSGDVSATPSSYDRGREGGCGMR